MLNKMSNWYEIVNDKTNIINDGELNNNHNGFVSCFENCNLNDNRIGIIQLMP